MAMKIGKKLAALRKQAGLTQGALATKAGVTSQTVSRVERDDLSPRTPTISALAKALGVPPSVLMDDEPVTDNADDKWMALARRIVAGEAVTAEEKRALAKEMIAEPEYKAQPFAQGRPRGRESGDSDRPASKKSK